MRPRAPFLCLAVLLGACSQDPAPGAPGGPGESGAPSPATSSPAAEPPAPAAAAPAAAAPRAPAPAAHVEDLGAPSLLPTAPSAPRRNEDATPGARLELVPGEASAIDLGLVVEGDRLSHVFHLRSAGTADLVLSNIKTPCKCTRARMFSIEGGERVKVEENGAVPPGTPLEVEVDISSHERVGKWTSNVIVYTNDPESPLRMSIKAEVDGILDFSPGEVMQLGELALGETKVGHMRISSEHLEPFLLTFVPGESDHVGVDVQPVDPTPEGRARAWDVSVLVGPVQAKGWHSFGVHLTTDVKVPWPKLRPLESEKLFEVHFYAQVQVEDPFQLEPRMLAFGRVAGGEAPERSTTIRRLDGGPLAPAPELELRMTKGEELAERFTAEVRPLEGEAALELVLRLAGMPESFDGSFQGFVDVRLGEDEVLPVRFAGARE